MNKISRFGVLHIIKAGTAELFGACMVYISNMRVFAHVFFCLSVSIASICICTHKLLCLCLNKGLCAC